MPLNNLKIKRAKPKEKDYKLTDEYGLILLVRPSGRKVWRVRVQERNQDKVKTIGHYPAMSLSEARAERDKIRADGLVNPLAAHETLNELYERWVARNKPNWSVRNYVTVQRRYNHDVRDRIGKLEVGQITPQIVLKLLRQIEARGKIETARRVKTHLSAAFQLAVVEGGIDSDPCRDLQAGLAPKAKTKNMARVPLSEIGKLWSDICDYNTLVPKGSVVTRLAMQLTILTWTRTNEVRFAQKGEIDLKSKLWTIPAERMKMNRDHVIPLSEKAISVIKEVMEAKSIGRYRVESPYLFPDVTKSGVISENRMLEGLYGLSYKGKQTVHGFRGLASTWAHESCYDSLLVELQLAHVDKNAVRAAYNHSTRIDARMQMLEKWAEFLIFEANKARIL